jgi:hypothetical protein
MASHYLQTTLICTYEILNVFVIFGPVPTVGDRRYDSSSPVSSNLQQVTCNFKHSGQLLSRSQKAHHVNKEFWKQRVNFPWNAFICTQRPTETTHISVHNYQCNKFPRPNSFAQWFSFLTHRMMSYAYDLSPYQISNGQLQYALPLPNGAQHPSPSFYFYKNLC